MKTEEDEAFDDLAKRQGSWGGGFPAKRKMAADKLQEPEREALKLALEELEGIPVYRKYGVRISNAIKYIKEALAQLVQEPVAWAVQGCSKMWRGEFAEIDAKAEAKRIGGTCVAYALYTVPPQRPWVGLTDDELADLWYKESLDWMEFARAHEAALKEKNNGT
jgi:hypothetical protein